MNLNPHKVLIIGAGGVSKVVVHKCAALKDTFKEIVLASRTLSKCTALAHEVKQRLGRDIKTTQIDADDVRALTALLQQEKPTLVINVALPYQDLSIMEACLASGVHYLDTANYEPKDTPKFEYKWQWAYQERFKAAKLTALLGCGFDPGVTNVFCAYAAKHFFKEISTIDIVDCNGGSHGQAFATNFNPEINIREITAPGKYFEKGAWHETAPLAIHQPFAFPGVGVREMYLLYHEELESLALHFPKLQRLRFWMTFGTEYLTHLRVLQNIGLTKIEPINFQGQQIIPLEFLKALLPDPSSLAATYQGKTCIGCLITGIDHHDQLSTKFIYNICDHQQCYQEVGAQAISYTTGVPAMIGAKLLLTGQWAQRGVVHMEQLDPDPFMQDLTTYGLPWEIVPWTSSLA